MAKGYAKLRGRITEKYGSQGAFAKEMNITEQTVTAKLSGKSRFSQTDIVRWCNALELVASDIGTYFFAL